MFLLIENLDIDVTRSRLKNLLKVDAVELNRSTAENKRLGIRTGIVSVDQDDVQRVLAFNGFLLNGLPISIKPEEVDPAKSNNMLNQDVDADTFSEAEFFQPKWLIRGNVIKVTANTAGALNESLLRGEFSSCGSIVEILLSHEQDLAFIAFSSPESVSKAQEITSSFSVSESSHHEIYQWEKATPNV